MRQIVFALIVSLLLCSCQKEGAITLEEHLSDNHPKDSTVEQVPVWPLSVGNTWTYDEIAYDTSGAVKDSFRYTMTVVAEKQMNNQKWYVMAYDTIIDTSVYYRSDENFAYQYYVDSSTPSKLFGIVKQEGEVIDLQPFDADAIATTIGHTDSVRIHSFTCLVNTVIYSYTNGDSYKGQEYYFRPGVGIVLSRLYEKTIGRQEPFISVEDKLVNYTIH